MVCSRWPSVSCDFPHEAFQCLEEFRPGNGADVTEYLLPVGVQNHQRRESRNLELPRGVRMLVRIDFEDRQLLER